jgi:hypothetical protein
MLKSNHEPLKSITTNDLNLIKSNHDLIFAHRWIWSDARKHSWLPYFICKSVALPDTRTRTIEISMVVRYCISVPSVCIFWSYTAVLVFFWYWYRTPNVSADCPLNCCHSNTSVMHILTV